MNPRLLIAILACAPLAAAAQNLTEVYQDARGYDAQYGAARQALQALAWEKVNLPHLLRASQELDRQRKARAAARRR